MRMGITDELREWANDNTDQTMCMSSMPPKHYVHGVLEQLLAIADRIDEEHEEAIQQALMDEGGVPMTDENMAEHGWVRLPKDADGVPVRVGDVMEWFATGETFKVVGIGDGVLFYFKDGIEQADWTRASTKRHHKPPTVEDVLEELLREYDRDDSELTDGEIIEMFAKRLKLAEVEDA